MPRSQPVGRHQGDRTFNGLIGPYWLGAPSSLSLTQGTSYDWSVHVSYDQDDALVANAWFPLVKGTAPNWYEYARPLTYSLISSPYAGISFSSSGVLSIETSVPVTAYSLMLRVSDSRGMSADWPVLLNVLSSGVPITPDLAKIRTAGYIVVTDAPYNANPNGVGDSYTGLQQAITDGYLYKKPVYFPPGTYMVSNTLTCFTWWQDIDGVNNADYGHYDLVGCSTNRPVIKLIAGSSGFGNAADPKPMMIFNAFGSNDSPGKIQPSHPYSNPTGYFNHYGVAFHHTLQNFIFDTNQQAGAIGVAFITCQWSSMHSIKVIATGSFAGIHGVGGCQGSADLEVQGGQYGYWSGQIRDCFSGSGQAAVGLRCYDQTVACVKIGDYSPTVFVGFYFRKMSGGTVIQIPDPGSNTRDNTPVFIDGVIETGSGNPIPNPQSTMYLRNVYITGTDTITQYGALAAVTGTGTWKRVAEYSCANTRGVAGPYSTQGQSNLLHRTILDGIITSPQQGVVSIVSSSSSPPTDIWSRHVPSIPYIDNGDYVDVTNYGYTPYAPSSGWTYDDNVAYRTDYAPAKDGTQPDALAAFNGAIAAAAAAGHNRVFVPRGFFFVSGPINLGASTQLFGASHRTSVIASKYSWAPTTGSPYLLTTVSDSEGTVSVSNIEILTRRISGTQPSAGAPMTGDIFNHVLWQVGRKSVTLNMYCAEQYFDPESRTNVRYQMHITGPGGGRHYWASTRPFAGDLNQLLRNVYISNATQPTSLYGPNWESSKFGTGGGYGFGFAYNTEANCQVHNSQNVRIYSTKREGDGATLWISGASSNIAHYGQGVAMVPCKYKANFHITGTSTDVLIAVGHSQQVEYVVDTTYKQLKEYITGYSAFDTPVYEGIALYKRGTINDAAMVHV